VTLLFTDVESSTQLQHRLGERYQAVVAEHRRLLEHAFAEHGGIVVDRQTESFFVAFSRARDAVQAAAEAQQALAKHEWPDGVQLKVRMGIHSGDPDVAGDRYVGLAVSRAARICASAHGGQVLLSSSVRALLSDHDRGGVRTLGVYRLKDFPEPESISQLDVDGLPTAFAPLAVARPPKRGRRTRAALAAAALLVAAGTAAVALVLLNKGSTPPAVLPNSVVRIDPRTLEPTQVVSVGAAPDLVLTSGGYVWVTHYILRDEPSLAPRNAGDRTLTRVDPATGTATVVGGGLAPCGLTTDPSGDVWVANCYVSRSGQSGNIVRIDARTLAFEATWPVPGGAAFFRGLAYGGGSLWVSDAAAEVTQVDPRTGAEKTMRFARSTGALAWSEGYGDLWIDNFFEGSLTRVHAGTGAVDVVDVAATKPVLPTVAGDVVWVGDWAAPRVARNRAVGSPRPRSVSLPAVSPYIGVWTVAAGAGSVWATTPRARALWRIDPKTNAVTRIPMPYLPTGVTADADGVWVSVRKE
jgi:class 3 adenylate cyclase/streptogramin lyase